MSGPQANKHKTLRGAQARFPNSKWNLISLSSSQLDSGSNLNKRRITKIYKLWKKLLYSGFKPKLNLSIYF